MKLLPFLLGLPLLCVVACADAELPPPANNEQPDPADEVAVGNGTGGEGAASSDNGPCERDCSSIQTDTCLVAVCNDGQYAGTFGECVIVPGNDGAACDDGLFCTVNDTCSEGTCGGEPNTCGNASTGCNEITCDEDDQSCDVVDLPDGGPCTPSDLCQLDATCELGECVGTPKNCDLDVAACNVGVCDPQTGDCSVEPDPLQDGAACTDVNDLCSAGNTCDNGVCQGGAPADCSRFSVGCEVGACDPLTGGCVLEPQPAGTVCSVAECQPGACDANRNCVAGAAVADGTACNDANSCTSNDVCTGGTCGGTAVAMCTPFFEENFETCPLVGWTIEMPWECGTPAGSGPMTAIQGTGLIGLDLNGPYPSGMGYATNYIETPDINLPSDSTPVLVYQHWYDFEGGLDGYNVQVSSDGGTTWSLVSAVVPAYPGTVDGQDAYTGTATTWERVQADISAFAGQTIRIRFAARSDGSVVRDGVFIDEVMVLEQSSVPVVIDPVTAPQAAVGRPYNLPFNKFGGSSGGWTIEQGGTNDGWLSIDPVTGVLSGTPAPGDVGTVTVNIRYEEPSDPSNFDTVTLTFDVGVEIFFDDFEVCGAWTLSGDWDCGAPTSGPSAAFGGSNVIATNLTGTYPASVSFGSATAISAPINLTSTTAPQLSFYAWYEWEAGFDGFNVEISTDGGATFAALSTFVPPYNNTANGQSVWAGDQFTWTAFFADLTAFAGQTVVLRFQYRSDGSAQRDGSYVDDVLIID
ncbi:MAG: choice-of-anchor J domain-containing protein [Myxococcota bacterium]